MGYRAWLKIVPVALGVIGAVEGFTAEEFIGAPRRSSAIPNKDSSFAVFSASSYSFETHKGNSTWNLLNLKTGATSTVLSSEVSEIVWLNGNNVLYINGTNSDVPGGVELWVADITNSASGYKAASLAAPLANLKAVLTPSGAVNFLVSGKSYENGTAYNPELAEEPYSSARIYDSLFVRHWDTYMTPEKFAVFSGSLSLSGGVYSGSGNVTNLLGGIEGLESPVQPFGGSTDYDISPDGKNVAFLSKDPVLNQAIWTASYIYLVPFDGSGKPTAINTPSDSYLPAGASAAPNFSPDGHSLAFLQQDENGYESDRWQLKIYSLNSSAITHYGTSWDRSPGGVTWARDSKSVFLTAEDIARDRVFRLSVSAGPDVEPTPLTGAQHGSVSAVYQLDDDKLLLSSSSLVSSTGYSTLNIGANSTKTLLSPNEVDAELRGLKKDSVGEFWYDGDKTKVHGWIVKPEGFDSSKKYPIAFLIHGGPQGSWPDSWSSRWNPKWFAEQGYVAIAINPTGSTGYGEEFTDAIQNNWGGSPYIDLVKGFDYILETYPFLDETRAAALGASYGGYMVNWIQGHDFGRRFKALVSHDGVFSTLNQYTSEELWFPQHDFNGTLWENRENYERWDPAAHIANWSTPELVIHNDLDYRLPVSEGLAVFNALQAKGVPSRFLNFPDENHWVLKRENALVWHKEVIGWINKWTASNSTNSTITSRSRMARRARLRY